MNLQKVYIKEIHIFNTINKKNLNRLVEEFIAGVETNTLEELGYHHRTYNVIYGISKAALNALTMIEARDWPTAKNLLVVSVTPRFCAPDMTEHAPNVQSAEIGTDSILYAVNTNYKMANFIVMINICR